MPPLDILLWFLSTFYLSHAITNTSGPFQAFSWARTHIPHGGLLSCIVCIAPYIAALLLLSYQFTSIIIYICAAAGASVLAYRWTGGAHTQP